MREDKAGDATQSHDAAIVSFMVATSASRNDPAPVKSWKPHALTFYIIAHNNGPAEREREREREKEKARLFCLLLSPPFPNSEGREVIRNYN